MDLKFSNFLIFCVVFWFRNGTEAQNGDCKFGNERFTAISLEPINNNYYSCYLNTKQANFNENLTRIDGKHVTGHNDDDVELLHTPQGNKFKTFSSIFCQKFLSLKVIYVDDAGVESIDEDSLLNCRNLEYLDLDGNDIRELPEDLLYRNSKLNTIWLENNKLSTLPEDLFLKQRELKYLNLGRNKINYLPSNIFRPLVKLEKLLLHYNKLQSLNSEWFAALENLQHLSLYGNRISEIPSKAFASLRNLERLWLYENKIKILHPNSFDGLQKLEKLSLRTNEISDLPAGIFVQLKNLRELYLRTNMLTFIHSDWFSVHNQLTQIYIQNNQIKGIDENIIDKTEVSYLNMTNNICSQSKFTDRNDIKQNLRNCFDNYQPRIVENGANSCGKVAVIGRELIIGGIQISRGSYPWIAALVRDDGRYFCGGTLISNRKVVTAAHCMVLLAREFMVLLGVHDLSKSIDVGRATHAIREIHIHPSWNPYTKDYDADIAVLVLEAEVAFSQYIQPICMMNPNTSVAEISQGVVVGYGKDEDPYNRNQNIAKVIEVPIYKNEDCFLKNYVFARLSSKRTFCGGTGSGTGVCKGDSGSGLVVADGNSYYLRGIVSVGMNNKTYGCDVDTYSIFTDVLKFNDWINGIKDDPLI